MTIFIIPENLHDYNLGTSGGNYLKTVLSK
jgi:hypothetical protein